MFTVVITEKGGAKRRIEFAQPEVSIGRVQGNDIILRKGNVSKRHARLAYKDGQLEVADLNSTNGTYVNGRKVSSPRLIASGDKIYIADFILTLEPGRASHVEPPPAPVPVTDPPPPAAPQRSVGTQESSLPRNLQAREPSMPTPGAIPGSIAKPIPEPVGSKLPMRKPRPTTELPSVGPAIHTASLEPLERLMQKLAERFDVHITEPSSIKDQGRWNAAQAAISQALQALQAQGALGDEANMAALAETALHEAVGLGALDGLLSDPSIKEVVVRGTTDVLADYGQGLQPANAGFSSRVMLQTIARRLAAQAGRRLGQQPIFHGVLAFGPQVTILQAPLAVDGPMIELRTGTEVSLGDLESQEWLTDKARSHLQAAVEGKRNILVVGPQGSGVSTLVSALAAAIAEPARAVSVESVPDLSIERGRFVSLCCANTDIDLGPLIREACRLRVDRLIIDDVTGTEIHEALIALGSREPGHLVGVHAVASTDPIASLVALLEASGSTAQGAALLIASTVDLVVQIRRTHEGHRVLSILEIKGLQKGKISATALYALN